ncbi:TPA: hypothetical protein EYP26_03125 [Candidatus Bathyarchaeota archaeon]|nr:hypothetical protein [Candidatus Bathyarchaeota archaeon]
MKARKVDEYLNKIDERLKPVEKIEGTATGMDARIQTALQFLTKEKTVELLLKNLGKVKVSADPSEKDAEYRIEVEKPSLSPAS